MNEQVEKHGASLASPFAASPIFTGAGGRVRALLPALKPSILLPLAVVLVFLVFALFPGLVAPYAPTDMDAESILQPPGRTHWFGADHFGRDIYSLLVYGAQHSLVLGVASVSIAGLFGGLIGLIAGYAGRGMDAALMRFIDVWLSVPDILLVIIIATALRPTTAHIILTLGLVLTPRFARIMRGQVVAVKERPFVTASRLIGSSHITILLRHILPHVLSPVLVMATLSLASTFLMAASLSFLGLGVIDDRPDWGFLLSQGRSYLSVAWWFATFPGVAITILVISVNLLGDALRARLDPRGRLS